MDKVFLLYIFRRYFIGFVMLMVSLIVFSLSLYLFNESKKALGQADNRFKQQRSQNAYSSDQLLLYSDYIKKYQNLQNKGVIGNDKRLQWFEKLQDVGEKFEIPAINFTLENAQDSNELKDYYIHPEQKFETTQMDINFHLLHEGDFFLMLKYLKDNSLGIFSVEECNLFRKDLGKENTPFSGFAGECEFQWYTLSDVTVEEESTL